MLQEDEGLLDSDAIDTLFRTLAAADPEARRTSPSPKRNRSAFKACIACILSAQSLDRNTAAARDALFALADSPKAILALDDDTIVDAIRPAGLYNRKCGYIKGFCRGLLDDFDGVVPRERVSLMALPGIGRKCADIVQRFTFGEAVIAVDTHVHRVCNRTGLARGHTEAQTARSLEARAPNWAKADGHIWLIRFAKRTCKARLPRCGDCAIRALCLYPNKTD